MKLSTCVKTSVLGVALVASSSVMAKECSDIQWKDSVLNEYPNIAQACQGVVEMNGREYVELDAKYVRSAGDQARLQFKHQDGSYGDTYQTKNLPEDFQINIDGRQRSIHALTRGSTLELFIPTDRFALVASVDEMPMEQEMMEEEPAYTALPSTASNVTLYALLGSLACSLALGLTVLRRKLRV
ncbi:hypothetical protein [Gilvimarinus xylanilyticus]|uniref:LPXTG cell wall anchor domain-containing protein n=1 Tax=Gilvimarinus xylanilyticus TaxID=2944139 RepID=A0A9X2KUN8_9GAMM|nr:hypothetical protein [Gilvimarinus xylanilyticus]MCP8900524.1 hypothetical protein [Gilvimarinus xylanilyticus]